MDLQIIASLFFSCNKEPSKEVSLFLEKKKKESKSFDEFKKNIEKIPDIFSEVKKIEILKDKIECLIEDPIKKIIIEPYEFKNFLKFNKNYFFNEKDLNNIFDQIKLESLENSYQGLVINHTRENSFLKINISYEKKEIIKAIKIPEGKYYNFIESHLNKFILKSKNNKEIEKTFKELREHFLREGYLNSYIDYSYQDNLLEVYLDLGKKIVYKIDKHPQEDIFIKLINEKTINKRKYLTDDEIIEITKKSLNELGFKKTDISIKTIDNDEYHFVNIYAILNKKTFIKKIFFTGNEFISSKELESFLSRTKKINTNKYYFENEIDKILNITNSYLISGNYYEEHFLELLKKEIDDYYQSRGIPFIKTNIYCTNEVIKECEVFIQEKNQYIIKKINIDNDLIKYLKKEKLEENEPVDYLNLELKASNLLDYAKKDGYLHAYNNDPNLENLIFYNNESSEVALNFQIIKGKRSIKKNHIIIGNNNINKYFIESSINKYLKKNKEITFEKINSLQDYLLTSKLFKNVKISLKKISEDDKFYYEDIEVMVEESDRKVLSLSFGFNTLEGFYLKNSFTFSGFLGSNRSLSLLTVVNQKYDAYGEINKKEIKNFTEGSLSLSYFSDQDIPFIENNIFLNLVKKQTFYFDVYFFESSYFLNKKFLRKFNIGLGHYFIYADQFNAKDETSNGIIQVGSLESFFNIDFRDNSSFPKNGFISEFKTSYAHSFFLSSKNIHFFNIENINKAYISFFDKIIIANYFSVKRQLNYSNEKVPIIKLAKFGDLNDPRGYDLIDLNQAEGTDITKMILKDHYIFNLKIEPRYLLTESLAFGIFYDLGSFYLNKKFINHHSYGLTLKYITPIGSLSIDYGVPFKKSFLEGRFFISLNFF